MCNLARPFLYHAIGTANTLNHRPLRTLTADDGHLSGLVRRAIVLIDDFGYQQSPIVDQLAKKQYHRNTFLAILSYCSNLEALEVKANLKSEWPAKNVHNPFPTLEDLLSLPFGRTLEHFSLAAVGVPFRARHHHFHLWLRTLPQVQSITHLGIGLIGGKLGESQMDGPSCDTISGKRLKSALHKEYQGGSQPDYGYVVRQHLWKALSSSLDNLESLKLAICFPLDVLLSDCMPDNLSHLKLLQLDFLPSELSLLTTVYFTSLFNRLPLLNSLSLAWTTLKTQESLISTLHEARSNNPEFSCRIKSLTLGFHLLALEAFRAMMISLSSKKAQIPGSSGRRTRKITPVMK